MMAARPRGETVQVGLRIKEALRAELEAKADENGMSLNAEITARLQRSLQHDRAFGDPKLAKLGFTMISVFAVTAGDEWPSDQVAYARGAAAVVDALIRAMPPGPDEALAKEAIISRLLTLLAQSREKSR